MWHKVWISPRKRKTKKNGKEIIAYRVCWFDGRGKARKETIGTDKRIAEKVRREKEYELNNGLLRDVSPIRLGDYMLKHLEVRKMQISPAYLKDQKETFESLISSVGNKWLSHISVLDIESWRSARLVEGVVPDTANKNLRTLSAILTKAKKWGFLAVNPCDQVDALTELEKVIRVLSVEELKALLIACPNLKWRTFVFLAATSGLREGVLCWLEWDDVDLDGGYVSAYNKDYHPTKSRRIRTVGLVPDAVQLLLELRESSNGSSYVFPTKKGTRMKNNVQRDFRKIVERARIEYCTVQDLRRTFVSHLTHTGINEALVQRAAGHSQMSTTLKFYTEIFTDAIKKGQEKLPYANLIQKMGPKLDPPKILRVVKKGA